MAPWRRLRLPRGRSGLAADATVGRARRHRAQPGLSEPWGGRWRLDRSEPCVLDREYARAADGDAGGRGRSAVDGARPPVTLGLDDEAPAVAAAEHLREEA